MTEAWRKLKRGDRVRIVRPIGVSERKLLGREFTIERFDGTHGYAVLRDGSCRSYIHPEALERVSEPGIRDRQESEAT